MKQEWIDAFFESLHLHKKYVMQAGLIVGDIPMDRLFDHDASKFTEAEYPGYARQFHGDKGDPVGFAQAWLHHIHNNPHHWQYWMFPDGYASEGSKSEGGILPIPETYAREMVADWMGASFAYTNSWDMTDWLNKNLIPRKIKLHSETWPMVIDILYSIGYRDIDNCCLALYDWSRYPK